MAVITVSSLAQLTAALSHASGGDVIALAAGDYGVLRLGPSSGFSVNFPSNVTITSADPLHPAVFTGLQLNNVSNLTVDSVMFDYRYQAGDPAYTAPFSVSGGANVTISHSDFDGAIASGVSTEADGYGYGVGLMVSGTTGVRIEGNAFSNFYRGLTVSNSTSATVAGNELQGLRSDGMDFIQVQGVDITGNYIHDFHTNEASGDHPDMIQFWTTGTTQPSTDITISGNVLDVGTGSWTQSIFMGNELVTQGLAGSEMFYRNVTITDNVITNGHYHGITVGQAAGVTIDGNTVLHSDGAAPDGADTTVEIPQINVNAASTGVTVTHNLTSAVSGFSGQSGWLVDQNVLVQDQNPDAPGYYGDVFISSSLTAQDGMHQFLAVPGGLIDALGAGATATRDYLPAPDTVAALFQAAGDPGGEVQSRSFDASLSLGDTGSLPAGATFTWDFGDGTTASGLKVMHHYAEGGHYAVTLTMTTPGGLTDRVVGAVAVQDRDLVSLGSDELLRVEDYESTIVLPGGTSAGIQLGAPGVTAKLASQYVTDLTRVQDFDITMRLDATSATSSGEVFRLHGSVLAQVDSAGKLVVQGFDDTQRAVTLTSGTVSMTDLKAHDIDIRLHDGSLELWVDGTMTSSAAFTGSLNSYANTDLTFGNPWGARNFAGDLTAFDIRIGESPVPQATTITQQQDRVILSMNPNGTFVAAPAGGSLAVTADNVTLNTGLHLGSKVMASVDSRLLADMTTGTTFDLSMEVQSDTATSKGTVFSLHNSLIGRINAKGEFAVTATTASGANIDLVAAGVDVTDKRVHDLDVRLTGGKLQLWVDERMVTQTDFSPALHTPDVSALTFGTANSKTSFHGYVTDFDVTVTDTLMTTSMVAADSPWSVVL